MAENENLASILVKIGLISIFTNSLIGYFSRFANDFLSNICPSVLQEMASFEKWVKAESQVMGDSRSFNRSQLNRGTVLLCEN